MKDARVPALCTEYGIEIVGKSAYPGVRQTRAPQTIARILRRRGEAHTRMVLTTLAETTNNGLSIDETGLWSVSDMVAVCQPIINADASAWLELFDAIRVGELQYVASDLTGAVPTRFALDGMLYERIVRRFGPGAAQPDLFDDRGPYGGAK